MSIKEIEARHQSDAHLHGQPREALCQACGQRWPCDARRLLDERKVLLAEYDKALADWSDDLTDASKTVANERQRIVEAVRGLPGRYVDRRPIAEPATMLDRAAVLAIVEADHD